VAKPSAADQKKYRDILLEDLESGTSLVSQSPDAEATTVGDIITITDIAKAYDIDRPLARAALQRLSGKDVSPPVLERIKQGQYKVVRLPQVTTISKGPKPTPGPVRKSTFPLLNIGDQLTVEHNPWGLEFKDEDVYFLKIEETGDYVIARVKVVDLPEI